MEREEGKTNLCQVHYLNVKLLNLGPHLQLYISMICCSFLFVSFVFFCYFVVFCFVLFFFFCFSFLGDEVTYQFNLSSGRYFWFRGHIFIRNNKNILTRM